MKKKLLTLVALMLCVVTVLASCATTMKFEKIVGDAAYEDENPTLSAAKKLTLEGDVEETLGDLVLLEKEVEDEMTYIVYNLATDAVVYTVTDSEKVDEAENKVTETVVDIEIGLKYNEETEVSWFVVTTETEVTVTETTEDGVDVTETETIAISMRNAKGEEFANYSGKTSPRSAETLDLICFDNAVYRIAEDGSIAKAFDMNAFAAFPTLQKKQGDFYYTRTSTSNGAAVYVYDAELNMVAFYQFPSYVDDAEYFVLNDGNVLIQYTEYLGEYADDYDFTEAGARYDLYSFLLNVEKNKVKELDLDYVLAGLNNQAQADNWLYSDKIENVAWICEIVDERVNFTAAGVKMVSLNNKGKIKGEIAGLVPNQAPEELKSVAPDRWVVRDLAGNQFLLNGDGEVMGNVNGLELSNLNAFYILLNNKIYDWDLNLKYDLIVNEAEVMVAMNHGVLMTNAKGETLFYANGAVKTLINEDEAEDNMCVPIEVSGVNSKAFFIVGTESEDGEISYKIYNDLGNVVITVDKDDAIFNPSDMLVCSSDDNTAVLFCGEYVDTEDADNNKTVYYRVG